MRFMGRVGVTKNSLCTSFLSCCRTLWARGDSGFPASPRKRWKTVPHQPKLFSRSRTGWYCSLCLPICFRPLCPSTKKEGRNLLQVQLPWWIRSRCFHTNIHLLMALVALLALRYIYILGPRFSNQLRLFPTFTAQFTVELWTIDALL